MQRERAKIDIQKDWQLVIIKYIYDSSYVYVYCEPCENQPVANIQQIQQKYQEYQNIIKMNIKGSQKNKNSNVYQNVIRMSEIPIISTPILQQHDNLIT